MGDHISDKEVAEGIIDSLISKGIKLLALDFDKTIVSVHTGGMWKGGTPKLAEEVRPCFARLIEAALNNRATDIIICIVTYSKQPVLIADLLKMVLPDSDVGNIIIRANTKDWVVTPGLPYLGKQQHIAWIATHLYKTHHLMIEPHEILLIDDDEDNIRLAREFGHEAMEVKEDISLAAIQDFTENLVVRKREPVHVVS